MVVIVFEFVVPVMYVVSEVVGHERERRDLGYRSFNRDSDLF